MIYEVVEISRDDRCKTADCVYVLVRFYDSEADRQAGIVRLTEDFQMPCLKETVSLPTLDAAGNYVLTDGRAIPEKKMTDEYWRLVKRKTVALDVGNQIQENIERHIATIEAKNLRGDRCDKTMKPTDKKSVGLCQRADVTALNSLVRTHPAIVRKQPSAPGMQ